MLQLTTAEQKPKKGRPISPGATAQDDKRIAAFSLLSRMRKDEIQRAVQCELGHRSFTHFVKQMWHVHNPSAPLVWSFHIDAISEHLQAVYNAQIQRLIISIGPGMIKSLITSVYFPAWVWLKNPPSQFLCTAANDALTLRDARRHREVCASEAYQTIYLPNFKFDRSQDSKSNFLNTKGGYRLSRTTQQSCVGLRADYLLIDDPIDPKEVDRNKLAQINEWHDTVFMIRTNNPQSKEIVIAARLHENDLTGHLLAKSTGDWVHLCLPMEYDSKRRCTTSIGWTDPRKEEGELLAPKFLTEKDVKRLKNDVSEYVWQSQYQQNPLPAAGVVFKRECFHYWTMDRLPKFDLQIASCDFNRLKERKSTKDTDHAVIDVWGAAGKDRYLLRQTRAKMGLGASIQAIRDLHVQHPNLAFKLIEKAANGPSVIAAVQTEIPNVLAVSVQGESKLQRATAVQPIVEAGRVFIPDPNVYAWVDNWLDEICGFPGRRRDDRVDTMTMALIWLEQHAGSPVFTFSLG